MPEVFFSVMWVVYLIENSGTVLLLNYLMLQQVLTNWHWRSFMMLSS